MNSAFLRLGFGLIFAVLLVYLLMVVNFQSWLDPFIIITALPAGFCGIVWMLFITHTTFSVPALMGAIMSVGVATANSILMVTFANDQMLEGHDSRAPARRVGAFRPSVDRAGYDHRHAADVTGLGERAQTRRRGAVIAVIGDLRHAFRCLVQRSGGAAPKRTFGR
jgi:hypothetical protein